MADPTQLSARDLQVRPGAMCEIIDYPPGATFGPRTLRDFELVWILHGSAEWTCAGRGERLGPDAVLLCRPGMTDEFRWDTRLPTRHAYVHFDLVRRLEHDAWPVLRRRSPGDPLTGLLDYLTLLRAGHPDRVADVVALLVATFVSGPLPPPPARPAIGSVFAFLRDRWSGGTADAVPVPDLAAAVNLSPAHLSRLFRREFGMGPAAAVEMLRLARAAELLRRSNLTVGAIATRCGFTDGFHLSKRFRAVYGMPPRDYRAAPDGERPPGLEKVVDAAAMQQGTKW